jgi:cell division protein FtsX
VSGSYFQTLGIPILEGRSFDARDSSAGRSALVVNETFARQFCRPANVLGTMFRTVTEPGYPAAEYQIIGVVRDAKYDGLREAIPPVAYAPEEKNPDTRPWSSLLIRASAPGAPSAVAALRRALAAKSPAMRLYFESVQTIVDENMHRERMLAWLAGLFSVIATALTGVGLFGVIAYIVSLRRSEIAVRMALGATPAQIVGMITQRTALVAAAGGAAGLLLSLAGARFAGSLLYGLKPNDPLTVGMAILSLLLVSLLASMWPALRATGIKLAAALRAE